ncbi:MAG: cyclase family protein [Gemmatimonadaceae bacterium]|nr:cyclase family protein [Gemmatimonadaceae bacterium]
MSPLGPALHIGEAFSLQPSTFMRLRACLLAIASALSLASLPVAAQGIDLARYILVDLTHEVAANGPAWPGSVQPFTLDTLVASPTTAMFRLTMNEHFATHLDAPRHAAGGGMTTEQLPLERLIAPVVVIDVQRQAAANRDYALSVADVEAHEAQYGRITSGSIVLLRTGWSRFWADPARYFGAVEEGSTLHFPSFGVEAARRLAVERGVFMLGVDAPSTDIGAAPTFAVHAVLGAANVSGLENLTNLDALPRTGALLLALPIKTRGGSGGPVRAVALVPR